MFMIDMVHYIVSVFIYKLFYVCKDFENIIHN
jgi:hypothetical protein